MLVYLLNYFLCVIVEKEMNKMDVYNLLVCFGFVLLCFLVNFIESKDLLDFKFYNRIVEFFLFFWNNIGGIFE